MNLPADLTSLGTPTTAVNEQFLLRDGYMIEANAWAAKDAHLVLPTIHTYHSDDSQRCGWRIKVNEPRPHFVQAFPEVLCLDSTKPWSALPANPLGLLPRQIGGIAELWIDYNYDWKATGSSNVAVEMWLMKTPDGVGVDNIAAEVMVWLDKNGSIQPAGRQVMTAENSPLGWSMWMSSGFPSDGGPAWPYFAFTPGEASFDDRLDLKSILDFLVRRGSITGDLWVRTVELGTEIIDGEAWFLCNKLEARLA